MKTINRVLYSAFAFSIFGLASLTVHAVPGSVVAWGAGKSNTGVDPEYGQSMVPAALSSSTIAVAAGYEHSVALKTDGSVAAWGRNLEGQTTVPGGLAPVSVVATLLNTVNAVGDLPFVTAADKILTIKSSENPGFNPASIVPGMIVSGPAAIAVGTAITNRVTSGDVTTLTLTNTNTNTAVITSTPLTFTLPPNWSNAAAITVSSTTNSSFLYASVVPGMLVVGPSGTVGDAATVVSKFAPVAVPSGSVTILNLSKPHATSPLVDTSLAINPAMLVTAVGAGAYHSLALKTDGSVVAWGQNTKGQTTIPSGMSTVTVPNVTIPSGKITTVTLPAVNPAIVAGMLVTGPVDTVGIGAKVVSVATTTVTLSVPNANVFATTATLTFSTGVVAIAGGFYHNVALKSDGTVFAWGDNTENQSTLPGNLNPLTRSTSVLPNPTGTVNTVKLSAVSVDIVPGMSVTGPVGTVGIGAKIVSKDIDGLTLTLSTANEANTNSVSVVKALTFSLPPVTAIAAGNAHTVALRADGTVVAWGRNTEHQCDVPPGLTGVKSIAAGSAHTVVSKSDGTVVAWGLNTRGQITIPAGLSDVISVSAGGDHSVALKGNTTVVAWGEIYNGTPVWVSEVVPSGLAGMTSIAAGAYHTLALGVPQPPVISTEPASLTVKRGELAHFEVVASSTATLSYQWKKNGVIIAGATAASYDIANAQASHAGHYTVVCTDSNGSVTSSAATLTVILPVAPIITSQPMSVIVRLGIDSSNVSFDVRASNATSYQWWKNGIEMIGAKSEVLNIPNVTMQDVGSYSVVIKNEFGEVKSKVASLRVIPLNVIVVPLITSSLATVTLPVGQVMAGYQIAANTSPTSYSAKGLPKGLKLNSKTGLITGTPTKIGTYPVTLQAKSKSAGKATATKLFIVQP